MTTVLTMPVVAPALIAVMYALAPWRPALAWLGVIASAAVLAAGIALAVAVTSDGPLATVGDYLYADSLSAYMLIVIGVVAVLATAASPAYLAAEIRAGTATDATARRYNMLVQAFIAAMALAVVAGDLGIVWVAVEATTIATAFLVGLGRSRLSVEAAWKYVVICSVGIALALLGAILLNYTADQAGAVAGLNWVELADAAGGFDSGSTRIAVALLFVGFGTKAGLAPLFAWLADAHGQAPAPVSALMSGVLLAVAFYAILRVKVIADAALGTGFARTVIVLMALVSLALAATLLIAQRDYKRMLAYSSIEHMGLIALGAAAGSSLAMAAVLLHILGHGLAKTVAFLAAGRITQLTGSSSVASVHALGSTEPGLVAVFGIGVLALVGMPPFSIFASTLGIVRAGFADGLGWPTAIAMFLIMIIAAALMRHVSSMLLGPIGAGHERPVGDSTRRAVVVPLVLGLVVCAALGITLGPLQSLLTDAAAIVGTTP